MTYFFEKYIVGKIFEDLKRIKEDVGKKQNTLFAFTTQKKDFNEITYEGWHWVNPSVTTANHPFPGKQGILEVMGKCVQRFSTYNSEGEVQEAVRTFQNGRWTSWSITSANAPNLRRIITQTSSPINVTTSSQQVVVNFSCPENPIAIIPYIDGGAPFMCSVASWTKTSATINVEGTKSINNRRVVLVIIY